MTPGPYVVVESNECVALYHVLYCASAPGLSLSQCLSLTALTSLTCVLHIDSERE